MKIDPTKIVQVAIKASELVMSYYNKGYAEVKSKKDNSPVTEADYESSALITESLYKLDPYIPVISEEGDDQQGLGIIKRSDLYWLVDPIDGTWSFIRRNGAFVINIALVKDGNPIFGVISSPLHGSTYYNDESHVYKIEYGKTRQVHPNRDFSNGLDFLVSDSNLCQSAQDFLGKHTVKTLTPIPSAYKFALMVEGQGDIYPRFKPTYTWDTAAGHALLKSVGGDIYDINGSPLQYNKTLLNPNFIAVVDTKLKSYS